MMEISSIDLWLADRWYAIEGGDWSLRNHWLTYDVIHHHGKQMIIAFALGLIAVLLTSFKVGHLRIWRQPVAYVLTSIVLLPSLAASLKKINTVVCPAELMRYGGELAYRHNFEYEFTLDAAGHCFPSGHASGGFALIALYFASLGYSNRPWRFALPGIFIGIIFALGQQARGQHFLS
ncbi:MAG: membrane-associated PAP2 superfamily phosphatase, partial [Rhodothermales bacterium]